jgi:hypothetical protein
MEEQINHDEIYKDLLPRASPKSPYSLSTRIEGRIRYTLHRINIREVIGKTLENFLLNLNPFLPEEESEEPRTLDSFFKQVEEEKADRRWREKRDAYYGKLS